MPLIIVDIMEGKTVEEKEKLIQVLTKAYLEVGHSKPLIIIHEEPSTNWGYGGKQASKIRP